MPTIAYRARFFVAVVLLAVPSPGKVSGQTGSMLVAVLALPSAQKFQTSRATDDLAQALASELRAGGLRVVVAGSPIAVPLEELAASANAAGVDMAFGVRSSGTSAGCARVLTPQAVSRPAHITSERSQAQFRADLMKLVSAVRYEASVRLAGSIESVGQWCRSKAAAGDTYVLQSVSAPTVVLVLPVGDQEQVARRLPAVVRGWAAAERSLE